MENQIMSACTYCPNCRRPIQLIRTPGVADRWLHVATENAYCHPDSRTDAQVATPPAGVTVDPVIQPNTLEVGTNGKGEVVVNHPDLHPDANGVGHIVFSPFQARYLAGILLKKAREAELEVKRVSKS